MPDPIAVYGAATGTAGALGAVWSIWHGIIRDRPRLRAKVSTMYADSIAKNEWLWSIDIMNYGRQSVSMSSAPGLLFRDGWYMPFINRLGDKENIGAGEKVTWWISETGLVKGLRNKGALPHRIVFKDDGGNNYRRRINSKQLKTMKRLIAANKPEEETQS